MGNLDGVFADPTLVAIDEALIKAEQSQPKRNYVGMSSIGDPCERKIWYGFHTDERPSFDAATLRRFEDGHTGEDLMAERLRMVDGVMLDTGREDGTQHGFTDLGGKFRGHADGFIIGIKQAPKTTHVWEHKQVGEKVFAKFQKLKTDYPEKDVLVKWNYTYYVQAVLYMYYSGFKRHYLTVSTPGGRDYNSVRTDANDTLAKAMRGKAYRIINTDSPPPRVNDNPGYWLCKMCPYQEMCHIGE